MLLCSIVEIAHTKRYLLLPYGRDQEMNPGVTLLRVGHLPTDRLHKMFCVMYGEDPAVHGMSGCIYYPILEVTKKAEQLHSSAVAF